MPDRGQGRRLPSRAPGRRLTTWWDPENPDYEALAARWDAHGWPQNGLSNEACGECEWEGELRSEGTPLRYRWTCGGCGLEIDSTSDAEVAVQMACAWTVAAGTHPDFCPVCE